MSTALTLVRRDLRERVGVVVGMAITVMIGVALFGASYDAFLNLEASYARLYDQTSFADFTATGPDVAAFVATADADPDVETVASRSTAEVPLRVGGQELVGRLVGMPPDTEPSVNRVLAVAGSGLPGADGVLLEQHAAAHFGVDPGDRISVFGPTGWRDATVAGIAASPEYVWPARSRQEVLTPPGTFAVVFAPESLVSQVAAGRSTRQAVVAYRPGTDRATVDARLESAAASDGLASFTRDEQPSNAALQEDVSGFAELSVLFPVLFLGAAGMALSVMLTRLVYAQRPLIGLLRASGASRRSIFARYLSHGLGVSVLGGIPGIALGAVLAGVVSRLYTDAISVPVTVIRTRVSTAAAGLSFAVAAGVLASLGASLRASKIEPAVAMRGDVPSSGIGGRSLVERIIPGSSRLPVRWLMVVRGIGRNRRRTVSTMIGIVLALVLVLASWGMIDTTQVLLDQQFVAVQRQDAEVVVADGSDAVDTLLAVDGVEAAEAVEGLDVVASTADGRYATRLQAFHPDTTMHRFLDPHGDPISLGDGVLAGVALRDLLGIGIGDRLTVAPAGGDGSVELRVDGFVSEPLGTPLYVSEDVFSTLPWNDGAATSYDVRFVAGVDRQAVIGRIQALDQVVAVVDSRALYETARSFMGLFYAFVGVMLVFGGIMAFALIASAVSANVGEREVELATLAASGTDRAGLSRLVAGENLGLTLLAIPIGVAAGIGLSSVFMSSFSSDLFRFDLHMRATTPVFASLGILLAAGLALIPSLRVVRRLDVPGIVRRRAL